MSSLLFRDEKVMCSTQGIDTESGEDVAQALKSSTVHTYLTLHVRRRRILALKTACMKTYWPNPRFQRLLLYVEIWHEGGSYVELA